MKPVLYKGDHALRHAGTGDFRAQWLSLYRDCPWATACQHPDFVLPWYEIYLDQAMPVLVCAQHNDGTLIGLLPLALTYKDKRLVGAGARQAEYHAWLERPETENAFIHAALDVLGESFPGTDLDMRYLPSDIPLEWVRRHPRFHTHFQLRSHKRPIIKVDPAAMEKQRRKKRNRQNFNRLSRIGEVRFERIIEHERFASLFDTICQQYDLRQETLYHVMPFTDDPSKKLFVLELHRRGLLHVSILTVNGSIAASHSGVLTDSYAVHLGISTLAPQFALHSPGELLISMLGLQLVDDGIPLFDLTPGGDEYKERYASDHDVVFELRVYSRAGMKIKGEAFDGAYRVLKEALQRVGIRTSDVRTALKWLMRYHELGFTGLLERMRRAVSMPRWYRYNAHTPPPAGNTVVVETDAIRHLFRFDSSGSHLTRWEFLKLATQRLEKSHRLYSCCDGERLTMYCWASPCVEPYIDDGIVLYDLYVHQVQHDIDAIRQFIEWIVLDLTHRHPATDIYFAGPLKKIMRAVLLQCGFSIPDRTRAPQQMASRAARPDFHMET